MVKVHVWERDVERDLSTICYRCCLVSCSVLDQQEEANGEKRKRNPPYSPRAPPPPHPSLDPTMHASICTTPPPLRLLWVSSVHWSREKIPLKTMLGACRSNESACCVISMVLFEQLSDLWKRCRSPWSPLTAGTAVVMVAGTHVTLMEGHLPFLTWHSLQAFRPVDHLTSIWSTSTSKKV